MYTITHSPYTGSSTADGYPTGDTYGAAVDRPVYGWSPGQGTSGASASEVGNEDYDRRVVTYNVLLVPDATPYSVRDQVILPGPEPEAKRTYFVAQGARDYNTGPFGYNPGGEVVIERVIG